MTANGKRSRWVPVPDYEGQYEVSSHGHVRSLKFDPPRLLSLQTDPAGYVRVAMGYRHHYVHRVVASAFIGPCPPDHEVAHINHVRDDNRAVNLKYATRQDNLAERRPREPKAECRRRHALTPDNVYVVPSTGQRVCRKCRLLNKRKDDGLCPHCGQPMPETKSEENP